MPWSGQPRTPTVCDVYAPGGTLQANPRHEPSASAPDGTRGQRRQRFTNGLRSDRPDEAGNDPTTGLESRRYQDGIRTARKGRSPESVRDLSWTAHKEGYWLGQPRRKNRALRAHPPPSLRLLRLSQKSRAVAPNPVSSSRAVSRAGCRTGNRVGVVQGGLLGEPDFFGRRVVVRVARLFIPSGLSPETTFHLSLWAVPVHRFDPYRPAFTGDSPHLFMSRLLLTTDAR